MYLDVKRWNETSCSTDWWVDSGRVSGIFCQRGKEIQKHTAPLKHVPCHLGIFFPIDALVSDREGLKLKAILLYL